MYKRAVHKCLDISKMFVGSRLLRTYSDYFSLSIKMEILDLLPLKFSLGMLDYLYFHHETLFEKKYFFQFSLLEYYIKLSLSN